MGAGGRARGWLAGAPVVAAVAAADVSVFAIGVARAWSAGGVFSLPPRILYALGLCDALAVFGESRVETLLTACFVHASIVHLVTNLYVLLQMGPPVERALGSDRTAAAVIACGAGGSLASAVVGWLSQTERTSVGGSGALCGLLAAALAYGLRVEGKGSPLARSCARWLGLLAVLAVAAALLHADSHVDHAAHAFAAVVGAALGLAWGASPAAAPRPRRAAAVVAAALVVGLSFVVLGYRHSSNPFAALGPRERFDLASLLIRAGQCDEGKRALDAAARLLHDQPAVLGLESEWRRSCGL